MWTVIFIDLMLPGVIVRGEASPTMLGSLTKGHGCAVKLLGNRYVYMYGPRQKNTRFSFDDRTCNIYDVGSPLLSNRNTLSVK